jgi:putative tryptophan/tyrosine transport system substrate-binding protein
MRRREFITLLGGTAAAWPMAAKAQRDVPTIGYLNSTSRAGTTIAVGLLRKVLSEFGYVEGRNLDIEFRFADNRYELLPTLAADLVRRRVRVIVVAGAVNATLAAKAATATIPIVFSMGSDPVQMGVVASLSRPGGNVTGVTQITTELTTKRLEMLRELLPTAGGIGLVVNPNNPNTQPSVGEMQALANSGGWPLHVVTASNEGELDGAIAKLVELKAGGFLTATDALFNNYLEIVALAARHRIPTVYQSRELVEAGGLMSYGASRAETSRVVADYTSRILKGAKPSDLPVQQATKVELVINLRTAKTLGLTFPTALLVRADEVIE